MIDETARGWQAWKNLIVIEFPQLPLLCGYERGRVSIETPKLQMRANVNVNNIFDTLYIAEAYSNDASDLMANEGFFDFGRTWNAGLRIRFI